jgi:transcriptional regulator with XRE-family HTH domain
VGEPLLDIDELGFLVKERRSQDGLSLRDAAESAEVSFNTLSRVERGHVPDLQTFHRIVSWLGLDPARFFGARRTDFRPTTQVIAEHLRHDPNLPPAAAEKIAALVQDLYASLVSRDTFAVHLRAARTFKPEVAEMLGGILSDIESALRSEDTG